MPSFNDTATICLTALSLLSCVPMVLPLGVTTAQPLPRFVILYGIALIVRSVKTVSFK